MNLPQLPQGNVYVRGSETGVGYFAHSDHNMRAYGEACAAAALEEAAKRMVPSDDDIRAGVLAFQSGHNGFDDLSDWRAFFTAVSDRMKVNT